MKTELKTNDAKKMAIDAIKSMGKDDQFIVLTMKDKSGDIDQINHCEDMFVARFIQNTLNESEATAKLVEYLDIKHEESHRESCHAFGDFLQRMAGKVGDSNG